MSKKLFSFAHQNGISIEISLDDEDRKKISYGEIYKAIEGLRKHLQKKQDDFWTETGVTGD